MTRAAFGLAASSWAALDSFEVCSFRGEATGGLDQWRSSNPLSVASNCIWRLANSVVRDCHPSLSADTVNSPTTRASTETSSVISVLTPQTTPGRRPIPSATRLEWVAIRRVYLVAALDYRTAFILQAMPHVTSRRRILQLVAPGGRILSRRNSTILRVSTRFTLLVSVLLWLFAASLRCVCGSVSADNDGRLALSNHRLSNRQMQLEGCLCHRIGPYFLVVTADATKTSPPEKALARRPAERHDPLRPSAAHDATRARALWRSRGLPAPPAPRVLEASKRANVLTPDAVHQSRRGPSRW